MQNNTSNALALKEKGNTLFAKKQYLAAYDTYTEAIQYDNQNAILYANRAACSLHMSQYLDVLYDAIRATVLDPSYAKGWARRAVAYRALGYLDQSIECWRNASANLPLENLSAGELRQKEQYTAELQSTVAQKASQDTPTRFMGMELGTTPWERAETMREELMVENLESWRSSAWVILGAFAEWKRGMAIMKHVETKFEDGQLLCGGFPGALCELTNAVLRDSRIFHVEDENWFRLYNTQTLLEAKTRRAWTTGGSRSLIAEAQERQNNEGWDSVRPAIATSVRIWIMRAFLEDNVFKRTSAALEYYSHALDVLEWGNQVWKDVSTKEKGVVFESTFVRGVRSLRLEVMTKAYMERSHSDGRRLLSDILKQAEGILQELESPPVVPPHLIEQTDPGFVSSFNIYPKGLAFSIVGFYHCQMVGECEKRKASVSTVREHLVKATEAYVTAADYYPQDDIKHIWNLHCGIEALCGHGATIRFVLPVMRRMREAFPKMKKIWEHHAVGQSSLKILQKDLSLEEELIENILRGKCDMTSVVLDRGPMLFAK